MATQKIETGLIADSAVTTAKLADNSVTAAKIAAGSLDDQVKGISSSADATAITIDSSENVGIGGSTITDSNLLNLQGSGASKNIGIVFNDTNTSKIFSIQNGGSALKFFDYTASAERMRIDSSGNVGIGVTPSAWDGAMTALQIDTGSIYANSNGATFIGANFYYDTTSNTNKYIESNPASAIGLSSGRVEFFVAGSGTAGNDVSFTEAMRIHSDGNVGIGTDDPQAKLHVTSSVLIEGGSTDSRTLGFTNANGSTGWSIGNGIIDSTHNFRIYDNTAGAARVTVDGSGNVGIGRTSISQPSAGATTLAIQGTDNNKAGAIRLYSADDSVAAYIYPDSVNGLSINTSTSHPLVFRTSAAERMRIDGSDGSVRFKVGAGDSGDSTTNTGSVSMSNTDLDSDTTYTHKAGRYLTSNGTGWDTADGKNPALVIHNDTSQTNNRNWPGIIMHNENNTTSAYGPFIGWGARSASGEYNTTYAWITGRPTGTGVDSNWRAGELELYTAPAASYTDNKPGIRITSAGLVQQPKLYDSNGFFWLRGTSNPSSSGINGVVFTTRAQAGSGNTSTTTGRYTTPVDGVYHFSTNIRIDDASTASTYFRIAFYTGTSASLSQTSHGQGHSIYGPGSYSTSYFSMQTSWSVYLSAGTEVGVAVEMNTGTYTIHSESQFSGHLVG